MWRNLSCVALELEERKEQMHQENEDRGPDDGVGDAAGDVGSGTLGAHGDVKGDAYRSQGGEEELGHHVARAAGEGAPGSNELRKALVEGV